MRNRFYGSAALNAATDTSGGGDWSTATISVAYADAEGLYYASDIQAGDIVFFDTGAFEPGTVSRYTVNAVSVIDTFNADLDVTFDPTNDNFAADLSYCVGGVGLVSRLTAGVPLTILPPFQLYNIPEKVVAAAENHDRIFQLSLMAGTPVYSSAVPYSAGDKVIVGNMTYVANGAVAAAAPFELGTAGATWAPQLENNVTWAGVWDVATTYAQDAVVASDAASLNLFVSREAANLGNDVANTGKWLPYVPGTTMASLVGGGMQVWNLADAQPAGKVVYYNGNAYVANSAIPANTAFTTGTTGATYTPVVDDGMTYTGDYSAATTYAADEVVTGPDGKLYVSLVAANTGAAVTDTAAWQAYTPGVDPSASNPFRGSDGVVAGAKGLVPAPAIADNTKYLRGDGTWASPSNPDNLKRWLLADAQVAGQVVYLDGVAYTANAAIPANTAFALGTSGATYSPLVDSGKNWIGPYALGTTYMMDEVVSDVGGALYVSITNANLGNALGNLTKWLPYTPGVDSALWKAFVGADGVTPGADGRVPAPAATDNVKFLRGDGTWQAVSGGISKWLQASSYTTGDMRLKLGHVVIANGPIPANTAFAWGTAGATWSPLLAASTPFKGVYSAVTAYAIGDIVAASAGGGYLLRAVAASTGQSPTDPAYFVPHTTQADVEQIIAIAKTVFTGATSLADGAVGAVRKPLAGDEGKYLRGDGTWARADGGVVTFIDLAAAAAAPAGTLTPGMVVRLLDDGDGYQDNYFIWAVTDGTWASATKTSITAVATSKLIQKEIDFFDNLTTDLNAINRAAPTSALTQAITDGLMDFADAIQQGIIDLPNIP